MCDTGIRAVPTVIVLLSSLGGEGPQVPVAGFRRRSPGLEAGCGAPTWVECLDPSPTPPLTQAFSLPSYSDPAVGERLEPVWFEAPPRRQPQGQAARAGPDRLGQQSKRFEQATM